MSRFSTTKSKRRSFFLIIHNIQKHFSTSRISCLYLTSYPNLEHTLIAYIFLFTMILYNVIIVHTFHYRRLPQRHPRHITITSHKQTKDEQTNKTKNEQEIDRETALFIAVNANCRNEYVNSIIPFRQLSNGQKCDLIRLGNPFIAIANKNGIEEKRHTQR